jgi:hypothetical protein
MAKVNISVDTDNGQLSVELNGKKLSDVAGVSIYEWCGCEDEKTYSIRLSTATKDDSGVNTYTEHVMECCVDEKERTEAYIKSEIDGFLRKPELTKAQKLIVDWLKK